MKGSDFIFDSVQLMYCKCHKENFKRGGTYIDSTDWIKKKKATINPKNEDDKCFKYAATVAFNFEEIESQPERVSNIIPFTNKYNWKRNYPSKVDQWKTFDKNNPRIALNILHTQEKEICPAWHYLEVKNLPEILRGVTSKHNSDFYCLNYLHSFRTENKLKCHEKVSKNKDFCVILMPSEKDKILELKHYIKSDKMSYIIYADIESLIRKIDGYENNSEYSSATRITEHIPCGYSMSPIWGFDHIEDKHTLYRGKDCMKKFCESLGEHAKV